MATDPTGYISIPPELMRGVSWKQPCRVATTASITIATGLNVGDTIDGVTLAAGDRVLVKDQATGSQNGIYVAGAAPARAFDMDQDLTTAVPAEEVLGAVVLVLAGTVNGGTLWRATNTTAPTLGTTAIAFTQITASGFVTTTNGGGETIKDHPTMGSAETFDPADGNIHTGTLTEDCLVTLEAPVGVAGATLEAWITQDATGGWALTIDCASGGTFAWDGPTPTLPTTAGVSYRLVFERVPFTANDWIGNLIGDSGGSVAVLDDVGDVNAPTPSDQDVLTWDAGASEWIAQAVPAVALDDLSDVSAAAPATDDVLTWSGAAWVAAAAAASGTLYEPLTSGADSAPELVFTADGRCVMVPVGD